MRDYYLRRPSTDIDVVVVGAVSPLAEALGRELRTKVSVFKTFGTAMVRAGGSRWSSSGRGRSPIRAIRASRRSRPGRWRMTSGGGTLRSMRWRGRSTGATFGELVDPFDGMSDLEDCIIRTPCDPDVTFSDDPLRMMRAVRFAAQLGFTIEEETFDAIARNAERIRIVSRERIAVELNKIVLSPVPSMGFELLEMTGLLKLIFPELQALKGSRTAGQARPQGQFLPYAEGAGQRFAAFRRPVAALGGDPARHRQAADQGLRPAGGVDVPRPRGRGFEDGPGDLPPTETPAERAHEVRAETGLPAPAADHSFGGSGDGFGGSAAVVRGG